MRNSKTVKRLVVTAVTGALTVGAFGVSSASAQYTPTTPTTPTAPTTVLGKKKCKQIKNKAKRKKCFKKRRNR